MWTVNAIPHIFVSFKSIISRIRVVNLVEKLCETIEHTTNIYVIHSMRVWPHYNVKILLTDCSIVHMAVSHHQHYQPLSRTKPKRPVDVIAAVSTAFH